MSERDARIVQKYREGMTFQAIGNEYDLTRERIRQIVKKAGVAVSESEKIERYKRGANEMHRRKRDGYNGF